MVEDQPCPSIRAILASSNSGLQVQLCSGIEEYSIKVTQSFCSRASSKDSSHVAGLAGYGDNTL